MDEKRLLISKFHVENGEGRVDCKIDFPTLPDNTEDLLLSLHKEFYGDGLANADALRILPKVVERLKDLGEIPS